MSTNSPRKRRHILRSGEQETLLHMYKKLKSEAEEEGVCQPKASIIRRISALVPYGYNTIEKVIMKAEKGEALVTPGKQRKCSRPVTGIDDFCKEAIGRLLYDKLDRGERVTVQKLHEHMEQNYETYLYRGSVTSLRTILRDMGFRWKKEDSLAYVKGTDVIQFKRACFIREYVRNMQSETPKTVVFLDETWIFMNGSTTYSWSQPMNTGGHVKGIMRRPPEGGRLVIVHAGTKDRFVPGVDLIFATNLKKGQDYHGAMNSDTFLKWVENQLIVGLRNLGSCLVVMDNASYHSKILDPQPTTRWKRDELITWLRQNGVTVDNNSNKTELQRQCNIHKNTLKRYVVDDLLAQEGHTVLRLPPYHSTFNAIELVWSVAKRYFNSTVASRPGQGLARAKSVWAEALSKVTKEIWANDVRHTEDIIMKYYNEEIINQPKVQELVIHLQEEDDTEEEDDNDDLATPLESVPSTSRMN